MYGGAVYAGGAYAGAGMLAADIPVDVEPTFSIEVAFTADALATPVWVDISGDVRSWDVTRGRSRELERFQPGRATIVLDNSDRDYDSQHATGPWFGNLRPMRRIRIRETFSGVTYPRFDGFVDRWNLDYPHHGKDAIARVTATDGFKVMARTDLGVSVYANEVEADSPAIWWRLDDNQVAGGDVAAVALNSAASGSARNGTFVGPPALGEQGLIVHDPGTAMGVTNSTVAPGTGRMGVTLDDAVFSLTSFGSWAVEMWVRPEIAGAAALFAFSVEEAGGAGVLDVIHDDVSGGRFRVIVKNSVPTTFTVFLDGHPAHERYHLVAKHGPDRVLALYVNGVKGATVVTTGTINQGDMFVGYIPGNATVNWVGLIDEVAVYTAAQAVDPLTDARIAAHYAAGTTPWQGDLPGVRAGRVLDEANWPAGLRELDGGETTFQSAELGAPVLEHLQKVAESEAGMLSMNRAGAVRLISRDALAARVSQATFGDDTVDQFVDLPGTAGNYISTPDSAANSVLGDIDIRAKVLLDDWTPAVTNAVVGKWLNTGNQRSYILQIAGTTGRLNMVISSNGTATINTVSTVAPTVADGGVLWVRATVDVDNGAAGNTITYYTSPDGVTWAQLGAPVVTAGVTSIFDGTAAVDIGAHTSGTVNMMAGTVYYAEVRNGINGPIVASFDADQRAAIEGTRVPSMVVSDTGEMWTVNGSGWVWGEADSGEIGYRAVTFDDGDATIRNRATISRLNGVARTDEDAVSVDEFGRFQYTLDGLLHDTDAHSALYAGWVVDNYGQPTRRVVSLELGPAAAGNEAILYPQMLGRELGDMVTVKCRPPGGGAVFSQAVVIEGIADEWDPHGFRTARWTLSPAPGTF